MKKLLFAVMLLVFAVPAAAETIIGPAMVVHYNQQDSPCFIGYSCGQNLGIDTTVWSQNVPDQGTISSPVYSGTQLSNLLGLVGYTPLIAIDINQEGSDPDYLIDYIKVFINGSATPTYLYDSHTLAQNQTGNGVSDYAIPGIDLRAATLGFAVTSLQFEVQWGNFNGTTGDNNDGKEIFFLVNSNAPEIPEPATMVLLGSGLLGIMAAARRRLRK